MNGAVAGSMRYYGADYGLNYGVSLPTIRSLAHAEQAEGKDHSYAKYLFQQQVREVRLAALHIADPSKISPAELSFWAEGIINSEVAEEASFALFQYVECVAEWLESDNELPQYTAILSFAKRKKIEVDALNELVARALHRDTILLNNAVITLLESLYREPNYRQAIVSQLEKLPISKASEYIREEMSWRMESL